jgi:hypothetical protein
VLGIFSYWLWPRQILGSGELSGVSLLLLPVATAAAVAIVAWRRQHAQVAAHPLLRFWLAFDFAFAAALSRLLMVARVL